MAISILLHFLLLWPAVAPYRSGDDVHQLVATLRMAAAPASLPVPPAAGATPAPLSPAPHVGASEPASSTVVAANAGAQDINTPTAELPRRSDNSQGNAIGIAGGAPVSSRVSPPSGDGLDGDSLRQYRLALAVQARRFKRYPPQAMEAGIGGTVEVKVAVAAGGVAGDVQLAHTSGEGMLDDAALDMMRKAAPRTLVPDLLRGRSFVISLPVVFDPAGE